MSDASGGDTDADAEEQRVRHSYLCASALKEVDGREARRKSAPRVTRILLDWDDTLFFTSALGRNPSLSLVANLVASASLFLQECCRLGGNSGHHQRGQRVERCVAPLP